MSVPKGDGNTPAEDGAGADRDGQQSGESAGDDESKAELQAKGEEQREDKGARKAASTEGATKEKKGIEEKECFVLARLQGTIVDGPLDGVERRFTSFFSKVALQLDPKAFPEVAAVEVRRGQGDVWPSIGVSRSRHRRETKPAKDGMIHANRCEYSSVRMMMYCVTSCGRLW